MRSVSVSGFMSMGQCNNGGHGLLSCFLGHSILLDFYSYLRLISPPNARYQHPLKPRDPKARFSVGGRNRHENTAAKRGGWIREEMPSSQGSAQVRWAELRHLFARGCSRASIWKSSATVWGSSHWHSFHIWPQAPRGGSVNLVSSH